MSSKQATGAPKSSYHNAVEDDKEALDTLVRALAKFEKKFCQLMHGGEDFTLRLELRGNKSNLLHARIYTDESERTPASAGV